MLFQSCSSKFAQHIRSHSIENCLFFIKITAKARTRLSKFYFLLLLENLIINVLLL